MVYVLQRHQKLSVNWCILYFDWAAAISTVTVHPEHRKMSYELIHWLMSSLQVIYYSVLALFNVFSKLGMTKCLLFITKSYFVFRQWTMFEICCNLAFRPKPKPYVMFVRKRPSTIGFSRWTSCWDAIQHYPCWRYGNQFVVIISPKSTVFVCYLLMLKVSARLLWIFVFRLCRMNCGVNTIERMFSDVS